MIYKIQYFITKYCYGILFICLSFHLFGSIFFKDLNFYGENVRIFNTILLFLASANLFFNLKHITKGFTGVIIFITFFINILFLFLPYNEILDTIRNSSYLIFLLFTLLNVFNFLKAPNRFDSSLIFASANGYLLIIELSVRILLVLYTLDNKHILDNIDYTYHTNTFIDTVYYCTMTLTSVGYGDILPQNHTTKMFASILSLTGQFYLVIIMSIMVSKYLGNKTTKLL